MPSLLLQFFCFRCPGAPPPHFFPQRYAVHVELRQQQLSVSRMEKQDGKKEKEKRTGESVAAG